MKEGILPPELLKLIGSIEPSIIITVFSLLVVLKALKMAERAMEMAFKAFKNKKNA